MFHFAIWIQNVEGAYVNLLNILFLPQKDLLPTKMLLNQAY
jgi:hypothetical protein